MKYLITALLTVFTLGGCATMNKALQVAASINDSALKGAEDMQCNRASVRAIRERYNTPEKRKAYNLLCGKTLAVDE